MCLRKQQEEQCTIIVIDLIKYEMRCKLHLYKLFFVFISYVAGI